MRTESAAMRRTMFLSQDGVVLCTTLRALEELDVLGPSLQDESSLIELEPELTDAGFGAVRVALRCLAGVGWLSEPATLDASTTMLRWTEGGRLAMESRRHYIALGNLLATFAATEDDAWARPWEPDQIEGFRELASIAAERWRLEELPEELREIVAAHLDGGLIVPAMLWLQQTDRLGDAGPSLPDRDLGDAIAGLLATLGWIDSQGGWTAAGRQARAFALNFGGVATYLPLLARLPELYRGELTVAPQAEGAPEWHVHRGLNLQISSVAHRRYFGDCDEAMVELFDREPLEGQPRFIADMGCGEGAWLMHLYELIRERTLRGRSLDEHPLLMVGVDPSPTAMRRAQANLEGAGIPCLVFAGDVTDPEGLRSALADRGLKIEDGLHIRAFIDHERSYMGANRESEVPGWSSGAYLGADGSALSPVDLERDLVAHLRRWASHTHRHGLFVLEAHCVAPEVTKRQLGAQHNVALDAHQAYSKQYPVDHAAWLRCAQLAGLQAVPADERRYPSNRPFVSVSVNRFIGAREGSPLPGLGGDEPRRDTWRPDPGVDLSDGRALHEMLFAGGDIRYPALWHSAATGFVVGGALDAIEGRLAEAGTGETIRLLDYGAGTGTATIELLKACRERGLDRRLERLGMTIEMNLVDLPSGWYAQAHELLAGCAWTRFHSLRSEDGGFRPLLDVTEGQTVDVAMANMVFHLIPPRALEPAMGELASVLPPGGRLVWSSPDLGPAGPYAVLLHDPNRALRERALERLGDELDPEVATAARERAQRRILPDPLARDVESALAAHFEGEVDLRAYEMTAEEIVRGLLVPSNQTEYLPEISDAAERERTIRELMLREVIPEMQRGPAGTALGLNLHWTLGAYAKRG